MPIFRAIGLGIFLLVLQLLVPSIFAQLQKTLVAFLYAGEAASNTAAVIVGSTPSLSLDPLTLPTTRLPVPMP